MSIQRHLSESSDAKRYWNRKLFGVCFLTKFTLRTELFSVLLWDLVVSISAQVQLGKKKCMKMCRLLLVLSGD